MLEKIQQGGLSRADVEEMLDNFILDCAAQEGATPEEINFVRSYQPPTNYKGKCSIACVGEHFALVRTK